MLSDCPECLKSITSTSTTFDKGWDQAAERRHCTEQDSQLPDKLQGKKLKSGVSSQPKDSDICPDVLWWSLDIGARAAFNKTHEILLTFLKQLFTYKESLYKEFSKYI